LTNLEREIQARTERFATELAELIKRAALESVSHALAGAGAGAAAAAPRRGASAAVGRVVRGGSRTAAARARKKGEKRSPEQLESLTDDFIAEVKQGPGRGIEAIAKSLRVSTKELALPVRKLLEEGRVKSRGQKRATKYFPK
jgi:hypothetical protein